MLPTGPLSKIISNYFTRTGPLNGENVSMAIIPCGHKEAEFAEKALFFIKLADKGEKIW